MPTVFLSGDRVLCDTARSTDPNIHTVATKYSAGAATSSVHPAVAVRDIRAGIEAALRDDAAHEKPSLPDAFELELWYVENEDAYPASFYPGARLHAPHCVRFETDDFFEIMRMLNFVL